MGIVSGHEDSAKFANHQNFKICRRIVKVILLCDGKNQIQHFFQFAMAFINFTAIKPSCHGKKLYLFF